MVTRTRMVSAEDSQSVSVYRTCFQTPGSPERLDLSNQGVIEGVLLEAILHLLLDGAHLSLRGYDHLDASPHSLDTILTENQNFQRKPSQLVRPKNLPQLSIAGALPIKSMPIKFRATQTVASMEGKAFAPATRCHAYEYESQSTYSKKEILDEESSVQSGEARAIRNEVRRTFRKSTLLCIGF